MYTVSCANTHHVTDLINHGIVKNTKTWISWEQNITFLQNKKILIMCLRWHILRSYCFVAEVTFKLCCYTLTWKIIEFYTWIHKKDASFVALYIIKYKTLCYDHTKTVFALQTQHRTLLSNFFTKQYFFWITTLPMENGAQKKWKRVP